MKNKFNTKLELLKNNKEVLLQFLKAKYPVFHNSNIFFRDFHYGIIYFLEKKDIKVSYQEAEKLAEEMIAVFENEGIFVKLTDRSWKINYPEFAATEPGDPF